MKFNRIKPGWYASEDGRYAVIKDITPDVPQFVTDATGEANDGWVAVFDSDGSLRENDKAGENLDWFDTKREAVACCERMEKEEESK